MGGTLSGGPAATFPKPLYLPMDIAL